MMSNENVADKAREMSDAELAATIATLQGEQQRRAAVPPEQMPDPAIARLLAQRHERMYGNHAGR